MKTEISKYSFFNLPVTFTGSERGLSLLSILTLPLGLLLIIGIILISLLSIIIAG